jgi:hypothetical protein
MRSEDTFKRMYVGKADEPLPNRLIDHYRKIKGRLNIDVDDMYFVCAYVERDLNAVAPESVMIAHRRQGGEAPWNGRLGFGPHDPGMKRDTQEPPPWDLMYPVRLDVTIPIAAGEYTLLDFLYLLKAKLPFLFRFEKEGRTARATHPDYPGRTVRVPRDNMTPPELLALPAQVLPAGWRVTILPGYAIMYRDRPRSPRVLEEFDAPLS